MTTGSTIKELSKDDNDDDDNARMRDLTRHGFAKKYTDAAIATARGLQALVCSTVYSSSRYALAVSVAAR